MNTQNSPKHWHKENVSVAEVFHFGIENIVVDKQTQFQNMKIVDFVKFGRALILDGKVQSTEIDEHIYHEALVHPFLCSMKNPKTALVIGGGEGATLREIYRHPSIEKATMVDIDGEVVDACKTHLKNFHQGAFEDKRTELVIDDARKFVERTPQKYDLIVVDISEALEGSSAAFMFTQEFYELCKSILTNKGCLVAQSGSLSTHDTQFFMRVYHTMIKSFNNAVSYSCFMSAFAALWGFNVAAKDSNFKLIDESQVDAVLRAREIEGLFFYDGQTHGHITRLPKHLRSQRTNEWEIFSQINKPGLFRPNTRA